MRGLTLLCLLGLFLTASTAWEPGSIFPMRSEHTFNTTTNTSMETEERKPDNTSVQATQLPVENTPGFPPPTVGEDTQRAPGSIFPMRSEHTFNITTNTTTNTSMETEERKPDNTSVQATQLPVENTPGFPPPTVGEDTQQAPGSIFPMSEHTFNITTNTTTNTSMETEERKPDNTSVQATQLPVENTPGFPPPTVGEDTQG